MPLGISSRFEYRAVFALIQFQFGRKLSDYFSVLGYLHFVIALLCQQHTDIVVLLLDGHGQGLDLVSVLHYLPCLL